MRPLINKKNLYFKLVQLTSSMVLCLCRFDTLTAVFTDKVGHQPHLVAALDQVAPGASPDEGVFLQLATHAPGARVIKSHLPLSLLPSNILDTCKVSLLKDDSRSGDVISNHSKSPVIILIARKRDSFQR